MGDPLHPIRQTVVIPPTVQIRVVFETRGEDATRVPFFECLPCEDLLHWGSQMKLWLCPHCGYELTTTEARIVAADAARMLDVLNKYISGKEGALGLAVTEPQKKGFIRWLWERLSGRPRDRAPSSKSSASG